MITIDNRFTDDTMNILKSLVHKQLRMIKHNALFYGPGAYGIVGLFIDDKTYKITNALEVQDYSGKQEDVAYFRFEPTEPSQIVSLLEGEEMIEFPICSTIKEIHIVCEGYTAECTREIITINKKAAARRNPSGGFL